MINERKIIGIVGTRKRDTNKDFLLLRAALAGVYKKGDIICSGGCSKGGDRYAYELHKNRKLPYLEFPANWDKEPKAAGFIRNTDIAEVCDVLIACVVEDSIYKRGVFKGGTEDTISKWLNLHDDKTKLLII